MSFRYRNVDILWFRPGPAFFEGERLSLCAGGARSLARLAEPLEDCHDASALGVTEVAALVSSSAAARAAHVERLCLVLASPSLLAASFLASPPDSERDSCDGASVVSDTASSQRDDSGDDSDRSSLELERDTSDAERRDGRDAEEEEDEDDEDEDGGFGEEDGFGERGDSNEPARFADELDARERRVWHFVFARETGISCRANPLSKTLSLVFEIEGRADVLHSRPSARVSTRGVLEQKLAYHVVSPNIIIGDQRRALSRYVLLETQRCTVGGRWPCSSNRSRACRRWRRGLRNERRRRPSSRQRPTTVSICNSVGV